MRDDTEAQSRLPLGCDVTSTTGLWSSILIRCATMPLATSYPELTSRSTVNWYVPQSRLVYINEYLSHTHPTQSSYTSRCQEINQIPESFPRVKDETSDARKNRFTNCFSSGIPRSKPIFYLSGNPAFKPSNESIFTAYIFWPRRGALSRCLRVNYNIVNNSISPASVWSMQSQLISV